MSYPTLAYAHQTFMFWLHAWINNYHQGLASLCHFNCMQIHRSPVAVMRYNAPADTVISVDGLVGPWHSLVHWFRF